MSDHPKTSSNSYYFSAPNAFFVSSLVTRLKCLWITTDDDDYEDAKILSVINLDKSIVMKQETGNECDEMYTAKS